MSDLFEPGSRIIYMKVGTHAKEDLDDIVRRKKREIDEAGFSLWGYGGSTCHPRTMVQPFAREAAALNEHIVLAMQPMNSKHFAEPLRADEYSGDGITWSPIPEPINVLGSRYALCLRTLDEIDAVVDLAQTRVAVGNSKGRAGDQYVQARVDKACLEVVDGPARGEGIRLSLAAELVDPFAVFLKN